MMTIRPIEPDDLQALEELVDGTGIGLTSLPRDRAALRQRIRYSQRSFTQLPTADNRTQEGLFFFVLEDNAAGRIAGTAAIKSGIGLSEPYYSYRLSTVVHASRELSVHKVIPTLYLTNDYTGCAEIGSLYLHPEYRHSGNGRLLSKCRFLFLAEFAERFPHKVVAEMRGVSDEHGRSPFWESLGRHFFSMEFSRADYLTGTRSKTFIAELMPRNPIYVPLLRPEAQAVIGRVHDHTRAALNFLQEEGFHYEGYVDIFDAGPTLEARIAQIRSVRSSERLHARIARVTEGAPRLLISNTHWHEFRCVLMPAERRGAELMLDAPTARGLGIDSGAPVRVIAPK
ncbi:MAG TPA: arginine N-succinyltransferase [Nitrococcus sp.]|nr:arginine N-succinyltransferase [Nitrococcus sp.]